MSNGTMRAASSGKPLSGRSRRQSSFRQNGSSAMATTSIWAVKGWLGKVVLYIENPEKTENPQFYRQKNMTDVQVQNLSDVIDYAARLDKTTEALDSESVSVLRQLVSGINCLPATARDEMLAVKKRFGKEDGVVAYHGYQSFAPGEATPEMAHEIGVKLVRKLWGEKYQVLVATHLDKENHLHSHFVVNSVSFVDGIRYHRTGKDYYEMRTVSDELCREYGLSVVEKPQPGKAKHYGEWRAEQEQRPTWRGLIRSEIDELIRESVSEKQFYYLLRQKGYVVKFGKDISVRPPGKERFVRLARNFGAAYTEDGIRRRILSQPLPQKPHPETPKERKKVYSAQGKWQKTRKITGFRALYLYYCYKLGVFPKRRPQNRSRLHFLLREDLMKLNNISQEVRLLARHHIDTAEQLALYKKEQEVQITTLSAQRRALQKALRTKFVRDSPEQADAHRAQIKELSERLKALRREVHLCNDIAERSGVMAEKLKAVREDEKNQQKEEQQHEHIR
ncbi:MAG: relaxase/mobilization nuclease domain-containing protein [Oscillospiraceae bacterium]